MRLCRIFKLINARPIVVSFVVVSAAEAIVGKKSSYSFLRNISRAEKKDLTLQNLFPVIKEEACNKRVVYCMNENAAISTEGYQ